MKTQPARGRIGEVGAVWFVTPFLAILTALLLFALTPNVPASMADPTPTPTNPAATAPYVSSDPSVPAASGVFTGQSTEQVEHVATF